ESWPEGVPWVPAPKAKVTVNEDPDTTAAVQEADENDADSTAKRPAKIHCIRGHIVQQSLGEPFRFNDLAALQTHAHEGLIATLASLTLAQSTNLASSLDDSAIDTELNETILMFTPVTMDMHANAVLNDIANSLGNESGSHYAQVSSTTTRKKAKVSAADSSLPAAETTPNVSNPTVVDNSDMTTGTRRHKKVLPRPEPAAKEGGEIVATPAMLSRDIFREFQRRDAFCEAVITLLQDGELPKDKDLALHLMVAKEQYTLEADGLLLHYATSHPKRGQALLQWVVPKSLRA
ncbi:MAG TPA: hypothetical protein VLA25_02670, partial [Methylotenera sp.]|nr:hypothetical protein [Methylotenera sp.]